MPSTDVREIRHFHLFCGLGGLAAGFNRGHARVGNMMAQFRCIGGVDVDPAGIRDFEKLAGAPGSVIDLFDREQFTAFHGHEPPAEWQEATPLDIQRAAGFERPSVVALSAPCKGFSGLLAERQSGTPKYQALNGLTLRGVFLTLEAFKDDPAELYIFENVPRIMTRGRKLLERISALFRAYGYAVAETTHDCGELGGLAQSRKRFLLVARHIAKVPPYLYEAPKLPLRGVGEILSKLPLPGNVATAGAMHRVPSLQWRTWVRLAFVEAGKDWRSLNSLRVGNDGNLMDFGIEPSWRSGVLGVTPWVSASNTIAGRSGATNGAFNVADPRFDAGGEYGQLGVQPWNDAASTIRHVKSPIQGRFSVADPRHHGPEKHANEFRIVPWTAPGGAVTGAHGSGQSVADPRTSETHEGRGKYRVTAFNETSGTVISESGTGNGAFAVADPRGNGFKAERDGYNSQGHYGVVGWNEASGAVVGYMKHDRGRSSVADPRAIAPTATCDGLPAVDDRLVCRIAARDGTWHRPFTTLELAALQSLFDPEEVFGADAGTSAAGFCLDGGSDSAWRERIGNAVPPDAAAAIASTMGRTLLLAWSGESFMLSADPIWVRPITMALAVDTEHFATF